MTSRRSMRMGVLLLLGACLVETGSILAQDSPDKDIAGAMSNITPQDAYRHVVYLCSDEMAGREGGSEGGALAAQHIAEKFEEYGLRPVGLDGTYFQPLENGKLKRGPVEDVNFIRISRSRESTQVKEHHLGKNFAPLGFSALASVEGSVVFGGYGITAIECGYDDFDGLDAKGKIVLVFDHEPQENDEASVFQGSALTNYASWRYKAENARAHGSLALLICSDLNNHEGAFVPESVHQAWAPKEFPEQVAIPVAYVSLDVACDLLAKDMRGLEKLQRSIDAKLKGFSFKVSNRFAHIRVSAKGAIRGMNNVVGFHEGWHPELKRQLIIVGAHYDHIGMGGPGSPARKEEIHRGANDNASGVAGVIEIAQALQELRLKRSVLLVAFDGEEKGLLGSRHYVSHPIFPLDETVVMLNMDMIGGKKANHIYVGAAESNRTVYEILVRANNRFHLSLEFEGMEKYTMASDQGPFLQAKIPGIFFYGGRDPDYHSPDDTPKGVNQRKMRVIAQLVFLIVVELGKMEERP